MGSAYPPGRRHLNTAFGSESPPAAALPRSPFRSLDRGKCECHRHPDLRTSPGANPRYLVEATEHADSLPAITVVIPAHAAEQTIGRTIESVLAQADRIEHVIVVVDGELDHTGAIAEAKDQVRVSVIRHHEPLGAQVCRNRGLALALTEHIMFLDADDYLEGRLLSGLSDALDAKGADVAFGPHRMEDDRTGAVLRTFVPDFASPTDLFWRWFGNSRWRSPRSDMVPPCAVLWRTAFLREIGGWDEAIQRNQDGELVARAVLRGARIALSNEGCGVYVQYPDKATISRRADRLESLLLVSDKVLATEGPVIDSAARRRACAAHDYGIAWRCFESGRDDLGRIALRRARAGGFKDNWGSPLPRLVANLFGLRLRFVVVRWLRRLNVRREGPDSMPPRPSAS